MESLYDFDRQFKCDCLCGIDEAGRGPLAGPVFAAAVILPADFRADGLNDSKKLSPKRRLELYRQIKAGAVSYGVDYSTVSEINDLNILNASMIAMRRAFDCLRVRPSLTLIDGPYSRNFGDVSTLCIVDGDAKSACIAAASIMAKVSRDKYMEILHSQFPEYMFNKHKGYGTAEHCARIAEFGASPAHRSSFLSKILGFPEKSDSTGKAGEDLVCARLLAQGYTVVRRNFRTRYGEIDIIVQRDGILAFVEVKTRKDNSFADGLEAVDKAKQEKIRKTAKIWLSIYETDLQPRFDAAAVYSVSSPNPHVSYIENAF